MNNKDLNMLLFMYESAIWTYEFYVRKKNQDAHDRYCAEGYRANLVHFQEYLKKSGFEGEFRDLKCHAKQRPTKQLRHPKRTA